MPFQSLKYQRKYPISALLPCKTWTPDASAITPTFAPVSESSSSASRHSNHQTPVSLREHVVCFHSVHSAQPIRINPFVASVANLLQNFSLWNSSSPRRNDYPLYGDVRCTVYSCFSLIVFKIISIVQHNATYPIYWLYPYAFILLSLDVRHSRKLSVTGSHFLLIQSGSLVAGIEWYSWA